MRSVPRLPAHTAEVMMIFGPQGADVGDMLYWSTYGGKDVLRLYVNCSDTFRWGTADGEEILPEDMPLLRKCLRDLEAVDGARALSELFAARKRGERPMELWMDREPPEVQELFPE